MKAHKEASDDPARGQSDSTERFPWVEVFRGLAILEVILHHVLGRFLREFDPGSLWWYIVASLNRTFHFAVPAFLMLSALVLIRSVLKRWSFKRYTSNRLQKALLPYLLWSGIYMAYRAWEEPAWFDWSRVAHWLMWGKAFPHLYFLAIALQLYLLLPLLIPLFRKRPPFWMAASGTIALTLGIYFLNRFLYRLPYVGSFVLWYTPTIALGLWLGSQIDRLPEILRRGWPAALSLTMAGLALYLPLSVQVLLKQPVDTFLYQLSHWCYTSGVSFLLLFMAWKWSRNDRSTAAIRVLGRYSLQIYLVHPIIIRELERFPRFPEPLGLAIAFMIYYVLALLLPLILAKAVARARVSGWVFGR